MRWELPRSCWTCVARMQCAKGIFSFGCRNVKSALQDSERNVELHRGLPFQVGSIDLHPVVIDGNVLEASFDFETIGVGQKEEEEKKKAEKEGKKNKKKETGKGGASESPR